MRQAERNNEQLGIIVKYRERIWDAIETHVPPLRIFCEERFRE